MLITKLDFLRGRLITEEGSIEKFRPGLKELTIRGTFTLPYTVKPLSKAQHPGFTMILRGSKTHLDLT